MASPGLGVGGHEVDGGTSGGVQSLDRVHGAFAAACRDVWAQYTAPGTFRAFCRAALSWVSGKGFVFAFPASQAHEVIPDLGSTQSTRDSDNW